MLVCLTPSATEAQAGHHELRPIADGVLAAIVVGEPEEPANGNSLVIINEHDVVVVDATISPEHAEQLIRLIRGVTSKPVRYVVNTHWHDDHVNGNMVFRDTFPGVEFVAHPFTRDTIVHRLVPGLQQLRATYPGVLTTLRERLRTGLGRDGKPLTPVLRRLTESNVRAYAWFIDQLELLEIVPPTITVADSLVLHRGDRIIRVLHLGRGNTGGDLVVHLPREGILATGDLVVSPIPFAFGSFPAEWVQTLERLEALGATTIVPGHGNLMSDFSYVERVRRMLTYVVAEATSAAAAGRTLEETRAAIDLSRFRSEFGGDELRDLQFDQFFATPVIERAWAAAADTTAPRSGASAEDRGAHAR
jgi:cyclase